MNNLNQKFADKIHVAIIMDGNGRWATRQGLPRSYGHYAGAEAVRKTFVHAEHLNIGTLTLFGMSSDNFTRPQKEVDTMMQIFTSFLMNELENLVSHNVRLTVIGKRDRLPKMLLDAIDYVETSTSENAGLHMRIAIDYSSRDEILLAIKKLKKNSQIDRESFKHALTGEKIADVDLVIRTSGEQRLSDFLLWESAYAELWFTDVMWPDFGSKDLEDAVKFFYSRERRFGKVGNAAALPISLKQSVMLHKQ